MNSQLIYQQYQRNQVETSSSDKLLIMLYQGSIKFLKIAKKKMEENDLEGANNYLIRAQDIISELMYSLDSEKGGDIAENLFRLYEFMNYQLVQANTKKISQPINLVIDMLTKLLDAWQQILDGSYKEAEKEINAKE